MLPPGECKREVEWNCHKNSAFCLKQVAEHLSYECPGQLILLPLAGLNISSLRATGWKPNVADWGRYVWWLHCWSNCSLTQTTNGCILCYGTFRPCKQLLHPRMWSATRHVSFAFCTPEIRITTWIRTGSPKDARPDIDGPTKIRGMTMAGQTVLLCS